MIKLKDDSVDPANLSTQCLLAIVVVEQVLADYDSNLTITSLNDAKHSETSLHYRGDAFDVRVWDVPDMTKDVAEDIRDCLNRHWDVVVEEDHIHVEYQPRRG